MRLAAHTLHSQVSNPESGLHPKLNTAHVPVKLSASYELVHSLEEKKYVQGMESFSVVNMSQSALKSLLTEICDGRIAAVLN